MPLSDLVSGGPACGPSNPLQSLGKRFAQDRSTQLDRFDANSARGEASSSQSFRAPRQAQHTPSDPAFFHNAPPQFQQQHAFDMQPLHGALPLQHGHASQLHNAPLDLNSVWEQRQRQRQSQPPQQQKGIAGPSASTRHFEASFRHSPALGKERQWAREYSPGVVQASTDDAVQQQYGTSGQQNAMMGMRMNMMNVRPVNGRPTMEYNYAPQDQHSLQAPAQAADTKQWDSAFTSIESGQQAAKEAQALSAEQIVDEPRATPLYPGDADEFAKTAGRLVSSVEHEQNDKFKQSSFLSLMRKIRDHQAGIHGTDIVEQDPLAQVQDPGIASSKGKGKAVDGVARPTSQREATNRSTGLEGARLLGRAGPAFGCMPNQANGALHEDVESRQMLNDMWAEEDARSEAIESAAMQRSQAFLGDGGDIAQRQREDEAEFAKYQNILGMQTGSAGAAATAFLQQQQQKQQQSKTSDAPQDTTTSSMEEDFDELQGADFVGRRWEGTKGRGVQGAQTGEWDALQKDWDAWQAGPAGFQPSMEAPLSAATAPQYRFHAYNPYMGSVGNVMQHAASTSMPADMQSVLEREAAVQADPKNAGAWFDLGIKQQENEREDMAIAALQRAIQIDPTLREAWLALAVSYTNEADRSAALESIERWIDASAEYRDVVAQQRKMANGETSKAAQSPRERHERVVNLLMAIARHGSMQSKIDPNVQVALGVLFNASEDYSKAVDCFQTALQVRPEDWLLYNRLGATLSNSGRSNEALQYYQQALELKPGFVRCHFNMSISCLNLKMYRDAASHIYTALLLQSESVDADAAAGGLGTSTIQPAAGIASTSLWETLRVACELMGRPDLAMRALERNLDAIDPQTFWHEDEANNAAALEDDVMGASAALSGAEDASLSY